MIATNALAQTGVNLFIHFLLLQSERAFGEKAVSIFISFSYCRSHTIPLAIE
jgi:hypothetical protein